MLIVENKAPQFSTKAFINGQIRDVNLQDYQGRWVMLYFYKGDFTYV